MLIAVMEEMEEAKAMCERVQAEKAASGGPSAPLSPDEQLRLLLADFEMSSLSKLTSAGSSSRFKLCTVAAFRRQALKGTPVATAPLHR